GGRAGLGRLAVATARAERLLEIAHLGVETLALAGDAGEAVRVEALALSRERSLGAREAGVGLEPLAVEALPLLAVSLDPLGQQRMGAEALVRHAERFLLAAPGREPPLHAPLAA